MEWIDSKLVAEVVAHAVSGRWMWWRNTKCKYISIRIDMRDGHCVLRDRDDNIISIEGLKEQHGKDL